jgi:hypothetical protein
MTTEDVLAMEADRALDALVAERVMGWEAVRPTGDEREIANIWADLAEPRHHFTRYGVVDGKSVGYSWWCIEGHDQYNPAWRPSTDIGQAWLVIEALRLKKFAVVIEDWGADGWAVYFITADGGSTRQVVATTLPLAVCQAALIAKLSWRAVA